MVELKFKISDEAFDLLMKINNEKYVEYRDTRYETIEEFENSSNQTMTLDSFKARNVGGTLYLIHELTKYNLICEDEESWHLTFKISDVGIEIIDNVIRKIKLEKLEKI